ncbi:MAG: hypothetical protein M3P27_13430 [Acidobacteriota bacterium]|nr:hypothetical protein [Acidobacteriota bacterium]
MRNSDFRNEFGVPMFRRPLYLVPRRKPRPILSRGAIQMLIYAVILLAIAVFGSGLVVAAAKGKLVIP